MCAIAGFCNNFEDNTAVARAMRSALKHRGPDSDGIFMGEGVCLVHTRLSIIDPENGKQPMSFKRGDEEYTIVYNGEIYNTAELRNELVHKGYMFETSCDTEVVLKCYTEFKDKCVDKFNGIFAFAVWEHKTKKLFFARDRMGVKPFFYSRPMGEFMFASEIKGILASKKVKPQADITSIAEIMLIGPARTQGYGVFKNIYELPPAHCGYYCNSSVRIRKYWDLEIAPHTDDFQTTVEKTKFLVTDAIKRQTVSDVGFVTFLSGGLDSSIISSVAAGELAKQGKQLKTFSVNYVDNEKYFKKNRFQPNSDYEYIKIMSDYLGSEHTEVLIDTPELVDALYTAVQARDLPGMADVDSSLLLFCKSVRQHAKMALSGECADEIFGGYPWYRDKEIRQREGFPWSQSTEYRASLVKSDIMQKINPEIFVNSKYKLSTSKVPADCGLSDLEKRMREMMRLNLDWFMQVLLDRKDRMSMYNGLEVRVPFCDYRIVEYLYNVPWEFKDYEGREKGLLRMACEDYLPKEIAWRKKSPYPKTHNPNYAKAVRERLYETLENKNARIYDICGKKALYELLDSERDIAWYGQLMNVPQIMAYMIQLDYWLEKYRVEIV